MAKVWALGFSHLLFLPSNAFSISKCPLRFQGKLWNRSLSQGLLLGRLSFTNTLSCNTTFSPHHRSMLLAESILRICTITTLLILLLVKQHNKVVTILLYLFSREGVALLVRLVSNSWTQLSSCLLPSRWDYKHALP